MNRPTHLPKRQPVGCFALLTAIAGALDLPQPARGGDEAYLAARSARADLAVAAVRHALREPRDQAAMTAIADLLQVQVSGIDVANLYAVAVAGPEAP
jgi:hypothetical protein